MVEQNARLQEALEQIQNDERLTADLPDESARVVLAWLEGEIRAASSLDETAFAARVQELRRGVKQVARAHAEDPQALIAAAKTAAVTPIAGSTKAAPPAGSTMMSTSTTSAAEPRPRPWARLLGRIRRRRRGWS